MRGNTIRIILFAFALLSFCETAKCGDALFYSRLPKYRDIKFDFPRKSMFFQGEVVMGDWKVEVKEAGISGQSMTGEDALEGLVLSLPPRSLTP